MNTRNTIQRMLILDAVNSLDCHPTADEIYAEVSKRCPTVSRGTVYRNLGKLADEGEILRVAVANAPDRFDRKKGAHRHFLCLKCGRVTDFGMPDEIDLKSLNDGDTGGAVITGCDIMYSGYCAGCALSKK